MFEMLENFDGTVDLSKIWEGIRTSKLLPKCFCRLLRVKAA